MLDRVTDPREPREARGCAVCGRVLDYYAPSNGSEGYWIHSGQDLENGEDHPAVPVSLAEIEAIGRCDFCNVDFPQWVVPAKSFEVLPGSMSHGDWGACNTCCELIATRRWETLIRRAAENSAYKDMMPPAALKASLASLYSKLKRNITGEPIPINRG